MNGLVLSIITDFIGELDGQKIEVKLNSEKSALNTATSKANLL